MARNTISVSVIGDVKDINRKLGNVEKQLGGFGKKMSGLGKAMAGAFAAVGAVAVFKDIVSGASDAQQSLGATETVFGKFADTVIKTSDQAAAKYGLSANSYRENANLIGSLFKNQGVAVSQLAGKTETMIAKASDLSATFGGSTKNAVEALSSAFKGEFDPLEKYGISLKQSTVNAEAMRLANVKSAKDWGKLTLAQQKAYTQQATTNLINKQSADSTGAFAKETNTLAHQQQVLAAKVQNVKDKIGTALLPILTKIASFVSDTVLPKLEEFGAWFSENILPKVKEFAASFGESVMPKLQAFGEFLTGTVVPALQALVGWLVQNQAWLMPIAVGLAAAAAAWKAWTLATAAWSAITKAAIAVQAALNVVMNANPIGIIILAVIALVAAIVYLWKTNEGFRNTVIKVWNALKSGVGAVVNWFRTAIPDAWNWVKSKTQAIWNAIKSAVSAVWNGIKSLISGAINGVKSTVSNGWNSVKSASSAAWNAVKSAISNVWNGIKSAVRTAIDSVVSTVRGIKGKITGIFSGASGWLLSAGRNILRGLIGGIDDMIGTVKEKLRNLTNLIPDWKGPADKDKNLLRNAGQLIMTGLIDGIDDKTSALKKQLKSVTNIVSGTDVGNVGGGNIALAMTGAGSGGVGNTYKIEVNVPPTADKASIGREVVNAIQEHERQSGKGWRT
jgi:phage-related protein